MTVPSQIQTPVWAILFCLLAAGCGGAGTDVPDPSPTPGATPATAEVLFLAGDSEGSDVFVSDLEGKNRRDLSSSMIPLGEVRAAAWSPDLSQVAFLADGELDEVYELFVISGRGGTPLRVSGDILPGSGDVLAYAWSPDGARIAYLADGDVADEPDLYLASPDGSGAIRVTGLPETGTHVQALGWAPDGSRIAYLADQESGYTALYTAAADGTHIVRVSSSTGSSVEDFQWSADSALLAYSYVDYSNARGLYTALPDGSYYSRITSDYVVHYQWSPVDARLAYLRYTSSDERPQLYAISIVPSSSAILLNGTLTDEGGVSSFQWSPDGSHIAYRAEEDSIDREELYTVQSNGTERVRVSFDGVTLLRVWDFQWSPTGAKLAFLGDESYDPELYVVDVDGSNLQRLVEVPGDASDLDGFWWSPDGQRLAVLDGPYSVPRNLLSVDLTGRITQLTRLEAPDFVSEVAWSSDGKRLLYTWVNEDAGWEALYAIPPTGGSAVLLSASGSDWVNLLQVR